MPLHFAESVLYNCANFRIVHLWGRYGSGKTALAWLLAYELMLKFKYRYILSNVQSAWADDVKDVFLADGLTADAIIILDEAGTFMRTATEVSWWLAALRKLNIIILCPSFEPPSRAARMLTFQRVFNGHILNLDFWWFKWSLNMGELNESGNFYWRKPSEIFGIFDTVGYPTEANEILSGVETWVAQARYNTGYATTPKASRLQGEIAYVAPQEIERLSPSSAGDVAETRRYTPSAHVVDAQRAAESLSEAARELTKALPVSYGKKRR